MLTEDELSRLKMSLNVPEGKSVIVAGSTRKGEEEKLLKAYAMARKIREDLLLILVPRHPQRADEIEKLCRDYGFKAQRKTSFLPHMEWDVLIVDTIGELPKFYALSDVSFVGGSLIPWGGHNLLEPAFYEKPIFFGHHMENFSFLAERFLQEGAAQMVCSDKDLIDMFLGREKKNIEEMGKRAKKILQSFQGATEKTIKVIEKFMERN
jgi:3-deoxy-D-manno-octulosonic-acid transferase